MQRHPTNRLRALFARAGSGRADRGHRGQALVELALILPVLLVLFSSALDLGRLYYSQITINNAAKEGAFEASRPPLPKTFDPTRGCDADDNRVICLVVNEARGSLISIVPSDVSLSCDAAVPDPTDPYGCTSNPEIGDTVEVTVTARFSLVTPLLAVFFGGQTFPIHSSSTAQIGVVPQPGTAATPTPTPTPDPLATPTPTPEPIATPTPTPACVTPVPTGSTNLNINPGAGRSIQAGAPTSFTMTAPDFVPQPGCAFTYTWSFGDGASASGASVTHVYSNSGSGPGRDYTVTLVVSAPGASTSWTGSRSVAVQ